MRNLVRRRPTATFFVLAFGLSWLGWAPYVLGGTGLGVLPFSVPGGQLLGVLPGAFLGPLTAAFIVTSLVDGRAGLRHWGARLVRFKVGWRWYAGVLLGVPAVLIGTTMLLPASWGHVANPGLSLLALYLPMLVLQFFTTAMAEEPGWRDFALPRLQERFGAIRGTVLLGTLWGCWHLPLFLSDWGGWPHVSPLAPVEFVAACIPLSLVMTWVFNRTGQSLPIVMILHAGINTTYSSVWTQIFPTLDLNRDPLHVQLIATTVIALVLIIATRGRLGLSITTAASDEAEHRALASASAR